VAYGHRNYGWLVRLHIIANLQNFEFTGQHCYAELNDNIISNKKPRSCGIIGGSLEESD